MHLSENLLPKLIVYFDYFSSDSENPFRPDGELAKEAEEFIHQLKEKETQKEYYCHNKNYIIEFNKWQSCQI